MTRTRLIALGAVALLVACLKPSPPNGALGCGPDDSCPDSYTCSAVDRRCYKDGEGPLGDGGAGDLAIPPGDCTNGLRDGNESDIDCGGSCVTKCETGNTCVAASDCSSGFCNKMTRVCVATPCEDGVKNNAETSIDCGGGACKACALGSGCGADSDCTSIVCNLASKLCVATRCEDGAKNGSETDADCGGATCSACLVGKTCSGNSDCASMSCNMTTKKCVSGQCEDAMKNGAESDVDCGGGTCPKCVLTQACLVGADCTSGFCNAAAKTCVATQCMDGVKNGTETDIDCGGSTCTKCVVGKQCLLGSDCGSGQCSVATNACVSTQCMNGAKDVGETDTDCGGTTCATCGLAKMCLAGTDCTSTFCHATNKNCVATQCLDGTKNGSESDVDCGASCPTKCALTSMCNAPGDCASGFCNATTKRCVATQCQNAVKDGAEGDVDCGGACATKCATGLACNLAADCASGFCHATTRLCVATQCEDGTKNGAETDKDCGGSCPNKCALSQGCAVAGDCTTNACHVTNLICVATQCLDGAKNSAETDIDCGGGTCAVCGPDKLCAGGLDCVTGVCSSQRCTLASGPPYWIDAAPLPAARSQHGLALAGDGQVYSVGGASGYPFGQAQAVSWVDAYGASGWQSSAGLPGPRYGAQVVADASGRIYAFGGNADTTTSLQTSVVFNPSPPLWSSAPTMLSQRSDGAAARGVDGRLYLFGGSNVAGIDVFNPQSPGSWATEAVIPEQRSYLGAVLGADGLIYVAGGFNSGGATLARVDVYNTSTKQWSNGVAMPAPRRSHALLAAPDGRIYAIAGWSDTSVTTTTVFAFSIASGVWVTAASVSTPRAPGQGAALIPDGRMMIAGGDGAAVFEVVATTQIYGPQFNLSASSGGAGAAVNVTAGTNFAATAMIEVFFDATRVATGATNASGVIASPIMFTIPNVGAGAHSISVRDVKSRYPVKKQFLVN